VSRQVAITGMRDEGGEITTIGGGDNPFAVDAPEASVTIQGLHFVRSTEDSIIVLAASGLVIAHCRIDGVRPLPDQTNAMGAIFAEGILVIMTPTLFPPTADQPGQPENVSGGEGPKIASGRTLGSGLQFKKEAKNAKTIDTLLARA